MIFVIILVVLVILVILWGISTYNKMVQQQEMIPNAMAQIASQVESRWDALTNLIAATEKYTDYEGTALREIVAQRSGVNRNSSVNEIEREDQVFQNAMRAIDVVVEQYPDLKAANVFQTTMDSVNNYENNVRQARMVYNDTVTRFNRLIKTFPNSIIAGMTGFHPENYFEGSADKQEMPQWS